MRIVMFGFQTWGDKTLSALIESKHDVALVVTHPTSDTAYKSIWGDSVADRARAHGIDVIESDRADDAVIERVKLAEPDVIVVNSWYTWMPESLYLLPPHGTLNLHDSLLPKFTGFSPVLWALISGETEIGLTAHRMDEGLDTGDILVQRSLPVSPTATGTELVYAAMELIAPVLDEALGMIESGTATWTPQDPDERTYFHKRSERDSRIDWREDAEDLERFVRALSDPYPNAFSYYRGQRIRVVKAAVSRGRFGGTPGRVVVREGDGAVVVTGEKSFRGGNRGLVLQTVRTDDGIEHDGAEFFRSGGYLVDDRTTV